MADITHTHQAREDLKAMWFTGYEQWGERQADAYFDLMSAAIERLAEFPEMGRSREDVRAGYRSLAVRQHLVFYTFAGAGEGVPGTARRDGPRALDVARHDPR